jgi:hydroxymethylpyrimidine pyrophosphatase-like HAD family hydrolase
MGQAAQPTRHILLATDLDRTLLPNGEATESPGARAAFARVAARPEVALAYVTGRHRALVEDAIAEYVLPRPDYVIGDVGTTIIRCRTVTGTNGRTGIRSSASIGVATTPAGCGRCWRRWRS